MSYQQQFTDFNDTKLSWLKELRARNFAAFETLNFPSLKDEAWKYTNVKKIIKKDFAYPAPSAASLPKDFSIDDLDSHLLLFINGKFQQNSASDQEWIVDLKTALTEQPEKVKAYLNQAANKPEHGFSALNSSFIENGVFIEIPEKTELDKPIEIVFINTTSEQVNYPRNIIIAKPHSKALIIEHHIGADAENYLSNSITEIFVETNAHAEHIKIQDQHQKSFHIGTTYANVARDAKFTSHVFSFGSALSRSDCNVKLLEQGAECQLNGLYLAEKKQHMDHHTHIEHCQPHGISREFYKGIINDKARAVFNGMVLVKEGAIKTDSAQSNKNLLLSATAEIDTKPELEIYNDDVKCAHGATIGQLDDKELFYLQSRGLNKDIAKSILTYAFAAECVEQLDNIILKKYLQRLILKRLPVKINMQEIVS